MLSKGPHDSAEADLIAVHETVGEAEILHVFDEVDIANARAFEREMSELPSSPRFVLDLQGCKYVDSSALRVLIWAHKNFAERLRLVVTPGGQVDGVLQATKLHEFLPIFSNLEDALGAEGSTEVSTTP